MVQPTQSTLSRIGSAFRRFGNFLGETASKLTSRTTATGTASRRRQDQTKTDADEATELTTVVDTHDVGAPADPDTDDTFNSDGGREMQEIRRATEVAAPPALPPPPPVSIAPPRADQGQPTKSFNKQIKDEAKAQKQARAARSAEPPPATADNRFAYLAVSNAPLDLSPLAPPPAAATVASNAPPVAAEAPPAAAAEIRATAVDVDRSVEAAALLASTDEPAAAAQETGNRSLLGSALNRVKSTVSTLVQQAYIRMTRQPAPAVSPAEEGQPLSEMKADGSFPDEADDDQEIQNTSLLKQVSATLSGWSDSVARLFGGPEGTAAQSEVEMDSDSEDQFDLEIPLYETDIELLTRNDMSGLTDADFESPAVDNESDAAVVNEPDAAPNTLYTEVSSIEEAPTEITEAVEIEMTELAAIQHNIAAEKPLPRDPMPIISIDIKGKLNEVKAILNTVDTIRTKTVPEPLNIPSGEISFADKRKYQRILTHTLAGIDSVNEWIDNFSQAIKTVERLGEMADTDEDKQLAADLVEKMKDIVEPLREVKLTLEDNAYKVTELIIDKPPVPMKQTLRDETFIREKTSTREDTVNVSVDLSHVNEIAAKGESWQNHVFADAYQKFDEMAENTDIDNGEVLELESDNLDLLVYTSLHAKASLIPAQSLQLSFKPAPGRVLNPDEQNMLALLGIKPDGQGNYAPGKPENLYALTASTPHYEAAKKSEEGKIFLLTPENERLRKTLREAYEDNKKVLNLDLRGTREQISSSKLKTHVSAEDQAKIAAVGDIKPVG